MAYDFDLFVIGGGSGGIAAARRATEYGATVGIAEAGRLGGTCVNRGCVPKKLMVYASRFPESFEAATGYGWSAVDSTLDWSTLIKVVNDEVTRLNGIYQRMLDKAGVQLFRAYARFVDDHTLMVGEQKVTADKILVAVGGQPIKPDIPGIDHAITSDDVFHLPQQPQHLVVLGGGYIGCEFASVFHRLGSQVTQVIRADKILRGFDDELREQVQGDLIQQGVRLLTESKILSITKTEAGVDVCVRTQAGEEHVLADAVNLAATGRRPNLENLGLENTAVKVNQGAIATDAHSCTAADNIFAIGDCTDRINLTPVAIKEGRIFADAYFGGKPGTMNYTNVPSAVFTTPELGTVGLTEAEAIAQYGADDITVYRTRFRPMVYTLPDMPVKTLMKLVVQTSTDKVLGAHMVGDDAAEIIQGVAIAVKMGATKADFDATVAIHPTSAEEFVTLR
ncbi:glutathione-disulfide reductase [Halomicronema hongdechloris C2206]|uniref:Glutathione reductase n=1 Tax=Halomicronema hongdechloris C2206 TaxID=1641165 RepID=A0A1Z3HFR0_9CYAN|nr:glutathione-disulfide reductase [Halomicronema hongdechloris]ASC69116.1 glutathione-disulfide reductase [Halomicronema hongdechloris C2206]